MSQPTHCPKCQFEGIYPDGTLWICPICSHEWNPDVAAAPADEAQGAEDAGIRDANGALLANGDSVTVLKELKIKGAASSIKSGTKVKNIRLVDATDGHNIVCKIDGVGTIHLKSEFVRKA
ncbi:MAG: zinc ribbon domain-containing protein YjdM [Oligoflexia bacterium]|nr:zinc ribbon domain-containing protein YjdM [Oligoflexia bacterium]